MNNLTLVLFLLGLFTSAGGVPNTNVTSILCNANTYTSGDPFAISLDYIVGDIEANAPARDKYDYYNISPFPNAFAYGHGACNVNISRVDCAACLVAAKTALIAGCPDRVGGRSGLVDCLIRYEQRPFVDDQ
ncbi:Antifungal protein ginkbilobin-like protein 1 [Linum grandiflorum]